MCLCLLLGTEPKTASLSWNLFVRKARGGPPQTLFVARQTSRVVKQTGFAISKSHCGMRGLIKLSAIYGQVTPKLRAEATFG
jgi:hypothetical protein